MAKHEVDFDDYEGERTGGYDGEAPKRGIYDGALVAFDEHTSSAGNDGFQWIFEITEEPYAGWRGYVYSNLDSSKWKTQQIAKAIQGGQEKKMILDTSEKGQAKLIKNASPVRLRITQEEYEGEKRGRIRAILTADGDATPAKGKGKKAKTEDPWSDDDD